MLRAGSSLRSASGQIARLSRAGRIAGLATTSHTVDLAFEKYDSPSASSSQDPVVITHGIFGSKQNWRSLSKAFAKETNRPVYTLDLRNHGASPHGEDMTYATMAEDILAFFAKHSLSNVSLIGHSMGGKVAMALALHPELSADQLSHLVVVDISPAKGPIGNDFKGYIKAMKEIEAANHHDKKYVDTKMKEYEPDDMVRNFLLTNLQPTTPYKFRNPVEIIERNLDAIGDFPYEPGERTWNGKTLFVKGAKSKYLNRRNLPVAEQYFPAMQLQILETGHWVHAEKPIEFVKIVTDFISTSTATKSKL
jgi:pimeloyl-ACP methyl ester carboxylesterase